MSAAMLEESLVSSTVVASVVLKALSSELSWVGAKAGRREPSSVRSKVVHLASPKEDGRGRTILMAEVKELMWGEEMGV